MRVRPSPITARASAAGLFAGHRPPMPQWACRPAIASNSALTRPREQDHERNSLVYCVSCRSEHQSSNGVAVPTSSRSLDGERGLDRAVDSAFERRQGELPVALAERHGAHGGRDQVGGEGMQVARQAPPPAQCHAQRRRAPPRPAGQARRPAVHAQRRGMRPGRAGDRQERAALLARFQRHFRRCRATPRRARRCRRRPASPAPGRHARRPQTARHRPGRCRRAAPSRARRPARRDP